MRHQGRCSRGEKMPGMGDTNVRSVPFHGSLCGVISLSAFLVCKQWKCEFILWGWSINTGEDLLAPDLFFAGRLRKVLDKHKLYILMHCIYYIIYNVVVYTLYLVSIYSNIYSFGNIVLTTIFCSGCLSFFLQKLHLKKMGCGFDFYFVYRGESSDSMFSVPFLFFFTALYFKDCFGFY